MRRAGIALELLQHGIAERPFRKHALDRFLQRPTRKTLLHLPEGRRPDAAGVAAMAVIELVLVLGSRDLDLLDVGHDDEITGVDMRRKDRLVLAAQPQRDRAGQPPKHLVTGIDQIPLALDILRLGGISLHFDEIRMKKAGKTAVANGPGTARLHILQSLES